MVLEPERKSKAPLHINAVKGHMNSIRQFTLELLTSCGCTLDTYMDGTSFGGYENALSDLRYRAKETGETYPFSIEEIAKELVAIGNENRPPEPYEFPNFYDWGHWGIWEDKYCLYDEGVALIKAIESNKPFDTGWHGFKKELEYLRIVRNSDLSYIVFVSEEIDSLEDGALIMDCLNDDEEEKITEDMIEEIQTMLLLDADVYDNCNISAELPKEATLNDILEKATLLARECHEQLHESFLNCMGTTLYVLYGYPEDISFIEERVNKAK